MRVKGAERDRKGSWGTGRDPGGTLGRVCSFTASSSFTAFSSTPSLVSGSNHLGSWEAQGGDLVVWRWGKCSPAPPSTHTCGSSVLPADQLQQISSGPVLGESRGLSPLGWLTWSWGVSKANSKGSPSISKSTAPSRGSCLKAASTDEETEAGSLPPDLGHTFTARDGNMV